MIPVVYQNGNFGTIDRLGFEVVDIEREHFNQAWVIGDIVTPIIAIAMSVRTQVLKYAP